LLNVGKVTTFVTCCKQAVWVSSEAMVDNVQSPYFHHRHKNK